MYHVLASFQSVTWQWTELKIHQYKWLVIVYVCLSSVAIQSICFSYFVFFLKSCMLWNPGKTPPDIKTCIGPTSVKGRLGVHRLKKRGSSKPELLLGPLKGVREGRKRNVNRTQNRRKRKTFFFARSSNFFKKSETHYFLQILFIRGGGGASAHPAPSDPAPFDVQD